MRDLYRWIEHEKLTKGLVDIKIFMGTQPVTDIDAWCQHLYDVLTSTDITDITNDIL